MLKVDAALGGLHEVVGKHLVEAGREDASGARRAIVERMNLGDFSAAARMLGCEESVARDLHFMFGDLPSSRE